jgi:hypothetical protein
MTEDAKDRCAQLAAEHPDRARVNWIPVKQKDGSWAVARIPLPPPVKVDQAQESHDDSRPLRENPRGENPWINPPPWIGGL